RHTRSKRDWSSDVCSSDLTFLYNNMIQITQYLQTPAGRVEWFLFFVPMFPKSEFPFSAPYLPPLYIGFLIKAYISNGCFFLFNRSEERRVGKDFRYCVVRS